MKYDNVWNALIPSSNMWWARNDLHCCSRGWGTKAAAVRSPMDPACLALTNQTQTPQSPLLHLQDLFPELDSLVMGRNHIPEIIASS